MPVGYGVFSSPTGISPTRATPATARRKPSIGEGQVPGAMALTSGASAGVAAAASVDGAFAEWFLGERVMVWFLSSHCAGYEYTRTGFSCKFHAFGALVTALTAHIAALSISVMAIAAHPAPG